ncbi:MAG: dipicolinate synthase subunit DpsA [Candidatus Desulforudis sp.]|nr:dipicolinate synthase subunit DpsA [Desulforudis sp.]
MLPLVGLRVSVLGGDARSIHIVEEFSARGAQVKALRIPVAGGAPNVSVCRDAAEALTEIDVLVIPLPGIDDNGRLYTVSGDSPVISKALLQSIDRETPIYTVMAGSYLQTLAAQLGLRVVELVRFQEFAVYNSIPTAEGAIQLAMERMPITIHGCRAVVLGFGNVATTLARTLTALGAKTTVVARNSASLARAYEMGLGIAGPAQLPDCLARADLVFNTIPAVILDRKVLESVNPEACIIDLASAPGGTDFEAARALGLNAGLAPNLPGKVAPKTAGQIIVDTVLRLLYDSSPEGTFANEGVLANAAGGR